MYNCTLTETVRRDTASEHAHENRAFNLTFKVFNLGAVPKCRHAVVSLQQFAGYLQCVVLHPVAKKTDDSIPWILSNEQ